MVWYPWRGALSAAGGMLSRLGTARQAHAARRDDDTGLLRSFNWLTLFLVHCLRSPPPLLPPPALAGGSWGWERPVNILCMDGGGIRGRNLLVMVEEIERMCGQPVSELFDLVAGTSIGGCGALFVSKYPRHGEATRMARRALTELKNCFSDCSHSRLLTRGHLCRDLRKQFVGQLCGAEQGISSNGPRAFAVAARRGRRGIEPFLFRTYSLSVAETDESGAALTARNASVLRGGWGVKQKQSFAAGTSECRLWQAIEATSAAPCIFPRAKLDGMHLVDGGLVANDPTLLALQEAAHLFRGRPLGMVVSLGTGAPRPAEERAVARAVHAICRSARYYRLQPPVRGVSCIEANEEKLCRMEEGTREHFRSSEAAEDMCRRLQESRSPWGFLGRKRHDEGERAATLV